MSTVTINDLRPTPEQIDALAMRYRIAERSLDEAQKHFDEIEKEAIDSVQQFGVVPPRAENSRRLEGRLAELTVTVGNTTTIDESRVQDLKGALDTNGFGQIFGNIFQERVRHELVKDATLAILAAGMPKRLTEKIQTLFGRCFDTKKKSPSLKVKTITVTKAKRPKRAGV